VFELPWKKGMVPHCVIEITQKCNLACRACYREKRDTTKSVEDILDDVTIIENHQKVHTISLAGGEPTLHPDLVEIVRRVKARGHRVSLVTNAVALTNEMLVQLKLAGLDLVMLHIDEGQERQDLPSPATISDINALRKATATRVAVHGIDAGLCVTLYPDTFRNIPSLIHCFLECEHINFLFATHAITIANLVAHVGQASYRDTLTRNSQVAALLKETFGLEPFAFIKPLMADGDELPCITYFIPVLHSADNTFLSLHSGRIDRGLVRFSRLLTGRYLYYTPNHFFSAAIQIMCNGFASGGILHAMAFLFKAFLGDCKLRCKRLVFENAPVITPQGTVNCCDFCPNATVRDGQVVPVCLADHHQLMEQP
jgi:hypothetical protein